jgi:hypothetical protein
VIYIILVNFFGNIFTDGFTYEKRTPNKKNYQHNYVDKSIRDYDILTTKYNIGNSICSIMHNFDRDLHIVSGKSCNFFFKISGTFQGP